MAAMATVGMSEAKANFSKIAQACNASGEAVTVFKNNRPWVEIVPLCGGEIPQETREAMEEAREIAAGKPHRSFKSVDELFEELGI